MLLQTQKTANKCTKYIIYHVHNFIYSDITVCFADQKIKAHKFVLAARGDHWSNRDLNEISELELTGDLVFAVFNIQICTGSSFKVTILLSSFY